MVEQIFTLDCCCCKCRSYTGDDEDDEEMEDDEDEGKVSNVKNKMVELSCNGIIFF